jgi:hypothetical protein
LSLPEGGAEWLERWRRDDSASPVQVQAMTGWLETLATTPNQYPSTAISWPYPRATGEARAAFIVGADAFVIYAVERGQVRILLIGHNAPEGFIIPLP